MKKKMLFISFGCLVNEKNKDFSFQPKAITMLSKIVNELGYNAALTEIKNVSQQALKLATGILKAEGIWFESNSSSQQWDLNSSILVSDNSKEKFDGQIIILGKKNRGGSVKINYAKDWSGVYQLLKGGSRQAEHHRKTRETDIKVKVNLDGTGISKISTGLHFFDHMLEQIARHGSIDLELNVKGDLHVDEHHTVEDTAIALGEAFAKALGDKRGIERYGFCLPMDDVLAQVALDFGGRNWLVWKASFKREKIGDVPTEMFFHFFKSFSDAAKCNLNIKAEGQNEHHKIEAIFKAFAKAIKMAVCRDLENMQLPSTKGTL